MLKPLPSLASVAVAALGVLAGAAQAAAPTATITASSTPVTFGEYTGTGTVGQGLVNTETLYFIDERSGSLGKSWYVFFEPQAAVSLSATLTFSEQITGVFTTRDDLGASNAAYGAAGVTYANPLLVGLEAGQDGVSFAGNTLTLDIVSRDPGDHIRVFTSPVPEPQTGALLAAGLLAFAFVARRRV